jgi:tetratricopeptide (TPR) repeat protein
VKHFVAILYLLTALTLRAATDAAADFDTANRFYAQGKFAEAATVYETIVAGGSANATLYFNLGNAYFKSGQLGRAIASYRRAERLAPRDPDIAANLRFARNHVSGSDAPHANLFHRTLDRLTLNEWTLLAAVAVWTCLILLALREWKPALRPALRNLALSAGLLALVLAGCTSAAMVTHHAHPAAVVTARDSAVKTGPLDDSQNAFTAKDGAELTVLDERDDWLQVTDARKRIGWVKRDAVQVL